MSEFVLYRKYRPITFDDVVNQNHVKTTLKNAVANNRIGHAYLFVGPRGVGKTSVARIFARAVNCPNIKNGEPCNVCPNCLEFLSGTSLDILEIDAASHTGVDNIRELIDHLKFAPTKANYKVIIIDEVHMLSKGAFNALLKSLEEPPKHAIFILATTEIHKVPATVVSRTQRFDFKKASIADLKSRLEFVCGQSQMPASDAALILLASAADGSFRDALSLLDQVASFAEGEINPQIVEDVLGLTGFQTTGEFLKLIIEGRTKDAVNFISQLSFSGKDLQTFYKDFLEYLRKILIVKINKESDFGLGDDIQILMSALAGRVTLENLIKIIEIFQKSGSEIKYSPVQGLPLELAAVESASLANSEKPELRQKEVPSAQPEEISKKDDSPQPELLQKIIQAWPQILEKLKDYNHSLVPSLKLAQPVEISGTDLIVTFPYKFHKDAVEARKNRIVVDQVIEEVTGEKLLIRPVMARDWEEKGLQTLDDATSKENGDKSLLESALKIIGGEMAE